MHSYSGMIQDKRLAQVVVWRGCLAASHWFDPARLNILFQALIVAIDDTVLILVKILIIVWQPITYLDSSNLVALVFF